MAFTNVEVEHKPGGKDNQTPTCRPKDAPTTVTKNGPDKRLFPPYEQFFQIAKNLFIGSDV